MNRRKMSALDPLARQLTLSVEPPSLADTASDRERLVRALRPHLGDRTPAFALNALRGLGHAMRSGDWQVTVTLADVDDQPWIVHIEPGAVTERCLGLAVDVGTTTISMELVDLVTGEVLGTRLAYNDQRRFGADITSRLMHAEKRNGLAELHAAVLTTLNGLVDELTGAIGVTRQMIRAIACAGNTTMRASVTRCRSSTSTCSIRPARPCLPRHHCR